MRFIQTQKLETWLTEEGFSVISYFLKNQKQRGLNGGIREIGVYTGGRITVFESNLLKGNELVLCNVFELIFSNNDYLKEIKTSYSRVDLSEIVQNADSSGIPNQNKIMEDKSINPKKIRDKNYLNFIHIGGCHLYNTVKDVLEFSLQNLIRENRNRAVVDYRSPQPLLRKRLRELALSAKQRSRPAVSRNGWPARMSQRGVLRCKS